MAFCFKVSLLFLSLVAGLCGVSSENILPSTSYCYNENGHPTRCEPPRNSFSLDITPLVNSTCGDPPTGFCFRQVDQLRQIISSDCSGVCNSSNPQFSHPPELMTDFLLNLQSWWQSENSDTPQKVVRIDIPLGTMVEVSVVSFNFISPLPRNFYVLKSNDFGETYCPFHYFSSSCLDTYGINPDQILTSDNETSVLCQAIPYLPSQSQISFFPVVGRPSNNDSIPGYSEKLYNFITATNISVVLVENFPINNREMDDFGYYYAIEDLSIIGSCQCHGHASSCLRDRLTGTYQCVCEHNTTGTFCERCADMYQDIPWQRADGNGYFECQACDCNNHTSLCAFDETVYEQSGRTSGGVCVECLHNTAGRSCEVCAANYYPRQGVPFTDPMACVACECNVAGITNDGECAGENSTDGVKVGDCFCKENVMGRTCSECVPGYFNLSLDNPLGCEECDCNATGSTRFGCNALTGECDCKPNVIGQNCDLCEEGFYMPDPNSPDGCQLCNCHLSGSSSALCDMNSGQCSCRPGLTGRTCSEIIPGYFFPSIDYLILEAEFATVVGAQVVTDREYAGVQVTDQPSSVSFGTLTPPGSGFYDIVIRYDLDGILTWSTASLVISPGPEEGDGPTMCGSSSEINETIRLDYTSWPMGVGLSVSQRVCLRGGRSYSFELREFDSGQMNSTGNLRIDSLVLIFVNSSTLVELLGAQTLTAYGDCARYFRSTSTIGSADPSCEQTIMLVSIALYSGALRCNCSSIGTLPGQVCAPFGGQCPCLPNVQGRRCDKCTPGFHSLSTTGCMACSCDPNGSQNAICDSVGGECECLDNVVGQNCSECAENFWGLSAGEGCVPCSCNVTGAVSLQCDIQSGFCNCKPGVQGSNCDSCQDQYYGFSQTGCRPCMCSASGSLSILCSNTSGQCDCKRNVEGRDCLQCTGETFNLQPSNPHGCQPCFCSGQSTVCTSAPGYAAVVVSTRFNETADHGWTTTDNETDLSLRSSAGVVLEPNTATYLQAPPEFVGNKLSSYSQYVTVAVNSSVETTLLPADVVLSTMVMSVGANFSLPVFRDGLTVFQLQLHEVAGWTDMASNLPIDAYNLQLILSSLTELYVTASYDDAVAINTITLDSTEPASTVDDEVSWVEQCSCPSNYDGFSCELCADGYTRSSSGSCEPCQCNGFADSCDPETGVCTNCSGFTTGDSCEFCQVGTYGDPLQGTPCLPCPCPLTTEPGQFSTNCSFNETLNQVMCFGCPTGHSGLRCESCINGYFGDPTGVLAGTPTMCSDCQCSGNINLDDPEACDNTSGICLQCLYNTSGNQCEVCADGYYGDAINAKNCSECDCDPRGSNGSYCDPATGQCNCLQNIVGRRCSECADGHFGYGTLLGCSPCGCHPEGAEGNQCDMLGQCQCRPGVGGLKCDQCLEGYFGLSSRGCTECSCIVNNSMAGTCDNETGVCSCQVGASGRDCSQCILNYFQTDEGCTLCPECYQELNQQFLRIEEMFNRSWTQLQQILLLLGDEAASFNDLLVVFQNMTMQISSQVNDSLDRYSLAVAQYDDLVMTLNQTRLPQVRQIQVDLSNLRRISTTVLVLASTSEELMNRTITDFVNTQQVVLEIRAISLNITQIVNNIEEEYAIVSAIRRDIRRRREDLSFQVAELEALVGDALNYSETAVSTMYRVQNITTVIQNKSDNIEIVYGHLSSTIHSFEMDITRLVDAILILANQIQQQLTGLPDYGPLQDDINNLSINASGLENHTTLDVLPEIGNQLNEYTKINRTLALNIERFNKLETNLSTLAYKSNSSVRNLTSLETETKQDIVDALSTVDRAQGVLVKLQNFSNSSQTIVDSTFQAAEDVQDVEMEAAEIMKMVTNITEHVQLAQADVQNASQITVDAQNVTNEAKQAASAIDLSGPLQSVLLVERNEGSIEDLRTNASHVSLLEDKLANYSSRIDQAEMSTDNATILSVMLMDINSSTTSSVEELRAQLDALNTPSQNISTIQSFIELLEQKLEMPRYDIPELYRDLHDMLANQELMRRNLEDSLQRLQEQVDYLEHVNSMLPQDCT